MTDGMHDIAIYMCGFSTGILLYYALSLFYG